MMEGICETICLRLLCHVCAPLLSPTTSQEHQGSPQIALVQKAKGYFSSTPRARGGEAADSAGLSCVEIHLKGLPPSPDWGGGHTQKSMALSVTWPS